MSTTATKIGRLYGLGVGPGDPELITVKAFRLMKEVDVIAYPKKRMGSKSYAHQIMEAYIQPGEKELLGLVFPMTKDEEVLAASWEKTAVTIWEHLAQGRDVAFVTEGDPNLYSTWIHMARTMKALYPEVEIHSVPGISSALGAAARLGLHLADGDDHFAIIPATEDRAAMRHAIENHDALVFIKVAKVIDLMIELLTELGLDKKASVVTKVTSGEEQIWLDIHELKGQELNYLTLLVVRK
ncbi:precorrin-2 C(20)-methyltransferase [Tumebacillus permanentifrigoris]|uniref:Precorrin-2/cobalt-factor-2 C20-methyltransferase n=1 Tax=Tumebacillus permanentifrigoris TaxID=378543 RepID=A0A316DBU0_9BACL|nr:precorrin-2 C(20)-methyltransferase [Tumebacillus permanentifrigoris]PWK14829.1 precorrin-2/cobalt-factor-2 C20-methyltransferase [Tumebacillus permanentifrigoris]